MRILCSLILLFAYSLADARLGDFSLLDHQGRFHQVSYYSDHKAAIVVVYPESAVADELLKSLSKLQAAHGEEIKILLLNTNPKLDRITVETRMQSLGVDLPVLMDESQNVARTLKFKNIGEAVILDPVKMDSLYRGDSKDLANVLTAVLGGGEMPSDGVAMGEEITYLSVNQVSYTRDIVPLVSENCVKCHRDGGIAPWSMNSHKMLQGFAPMIREVVLTRRMPPGQIDTQVGKHIADVAGLSIEEQQKLLAWIDAGAPKDGVEDPLAEVQPESSDFSFGKPNLVFQVPAQEIPATGVIDYRYVPVELNLDRDVWISAMEFVPGDRQVLHHVIAYLTSPNNKSSSGGLGESIAGFAPGRQPDHFGSNAGRLIPKGSNLLLQMHYTTSGRETTDTTRVGVYLHKVPPEFVMSGGAASQRRFLVPPHEKEYVLSGRQEIERDAYLYQMTPHMHFRGKYMSYTAQYPDGTSELLLSVPKYDFNWQFSYRLQEPVFLPAGTVLVAEGAMDNSAQNPGNPDPSRPVHFGLQTMHEMFFGFTTLRYIGDSPQAVTETFSHTGSVIGGQ